MGRVWGNPRLIGDTSLISALGQTFTYYVSPTGNDANSGTLGFPWAITSLMKGTQNSFNVANFAKTRGQRVGFLPGTYNVSAYMATDSFTGAFQIDSGTGSTEITYYGSANSSGIYAQGTATITALTSGGLPGGGLSYPDNGPILGGCTNTPHTGGWVTVDGLIFTAFTYKAIRIGGVSSGDGPAITGNVSIQNCTFTGQFFQSGATIDNAACIWLDGVAGTTVNSGNWLITNNYFYNNNNAGMGTSSSVSQHLAAIFIFNCAGVNITYNTCINSGTGAWGKDKLNQGTTCAWNYFDVSGSFTGSQAAGSYGFSDFTGTYSGGADQITSGLTLPSSFHHNVIVTNGWGFGLRGAANNESWIVPPTVYNNTIVRVSGGTAYPAIWANMYTSDEGEFTAYNNIITGVADGSGYGVIYTSALAIALLDYNGEMSSGMSWDLGPAGQGNSITAQYTSHTTFSSAVVTGGGPACETHSMFNNTPSFVGSGAQLAQHYQLQSGSPFKGVGSTTGLSSGSSCDMGAWGGLIVPTQIGCSFGP